MSVARLVDRSIADQAKRIPSCAVNGRQLQSISASPNVFLQNGLYVYRVNGGELAHGSSLGNAKTWATSKGTGAVESLYSIDVGNDVMGSLVIGYFTPHNDLSHFGCPRSRMMADEKCDQFVMLSQQGESAFHLHAGYQQKHFSTIGMMEVTETFFLPRTGLDDDAVVYQVCHMTNRGNCEINLSVIACADFVGRTAQDIRAEYDESIGGLIAWNEGTPDWIRAFCAIPEPDRFVATTDIEESYDPGEPLSNSTDETGRIVGSLQKDVTLNPGESFEIAFMLAFTPNGREELERIYDRYRDHNRWFDATMEHYETMLGLSQVTTPDPIVNQGGQWSSANMLRVLADFPYGGTGFTNNPGISSNVVGRDVFWYIHGCDYVTPRVSCRLLGNFADLQEEDGKIVEYYNALTGRTEDYGLNINDNTPLFILAAAHHLNSTAHKECVKRFYPAIVKAARYIISQEDDRGLVFCTSRGTGARGICGWRNIIENKNISGAVTEVNSECYAALRSVADIAARLGIEEDRDYFASEAGKLRDAMNEHLLNPKNGTYYLNIDPDGNRHTEVTSDEVFPLLYGVADEQTAQLISTRLSSPDFLTSAGLRTVPEQDPLYRPDKYVGLEGGVWPGVTWWYALASATTDPALMVRALRSSYRHYIENPGAHNTVPGQFSEWFDGESLTNRGMRLSPWEPPRFLWALLEGAVGIEINLEKLSVNPRIPPDWLWLMLRNLPYHERTVSFFMARHIGGMQFYTVSDFESRSDVEKYEEDISDRVYSLSGDMYTMAFRRSDETVICLASAASEKQTAAFDTDGLFSGAGRYSINIYSSETGDWAELGSYPGEALHNLSAWIEPGGFSILKVREA